MNYYTNLIDQEGGKTIRSNGSYCPKDHTLRRGYVTKRNNKEIYVRPSCIPKPSNRTQTEKDKIIIDSKNKMYKMLKNHHKEKCPKGQILRNGYIREAHTRKGYTRSDGTYVKAAKIAKTIVPPTCVIDQGKEGKGPKIPVVLEKNVLSKYGYSEIKDLTENQRHRALNKALRDINNDNLTIRKRLFYLATLNKNKDRKLYNILRNDAEWLKNKKK